MRIAILAFSLAVVVGIFFPGPAGGADPAKGKAVYDQYCAGCHGSTGKADGPAAGSLNPKPRDLSDKKYAGSLKEGYLLEIIKNGGPAAKKSPLMPAMGKTLKDDQVKDVVAYLRSLAK